MENLSHDELCEIAIKWLKKHDGNAVVPNCPIIFREMKAFTDYGEIPDVIGFGQGKSVVLECKISHEDFLADKKKEFRKNENINKGMGNLRFYFCPRGLINRNELPNVWGLIEIGEGLIRIRTNSLELKPDVNYKAERNFLLSAMRRAGIDGIIRTGGKA